MIRKPINAKLEGDSVRLWFERTEAEMTGDDWDIGPVEKQFQMRGGVCWPKTFDAGADKSPSLGYAMMGGMDLNTGIITIFEETDFVVIEPIVRNGAVEYEGIARWFNRNWTRYFAKDYYWNQDKVLTKSYRLETIRSKMVEPKPVFIEVDWADESDARSLLWRRIQMGLLKGQEGSTLHRQIQAAQKQEKESEVHPAIHALECMLVGFHKYPYRKYAA